MAESEACSSSNDLTESDMAAAHQLMLLGDEDDKYIIIGKRFRSFVEEEEVDEIKKIYRKGGGLATKKQRRYRSLEHIYMATTPIINA